MKLFVILAIYLFLGIQTYSQTLPDRFEYIRSISNASEEFPSGGQVRDLQHLRLHGIDSVWNDSEWVFDRIDHFSNNNDCLLATDTSFDDTGLALNLYTYHYAPDLWNAFSEIDVFQWNGSSWDSVSRETHTYYSQGPFLKTTIVVEYNGGSWDTTSYHERIRTFDGANRPLTFVQQDFDFSLHELVNSYQELYEYYPDSTLSGFVSYSWNGISFVPQNHFIGYSYNFYNTPYDYEINHYFGQSWVGIWQTTWRDTFLH